jgi:hypothetical protein
LKNECDSGHITAYKKKIQIPGGYDSEPDGGPRGGKHSMKHCDKRNQWYCAQTFFPSENRFSVANHVFVT